MIGMLARLGGVLGERDKKEGSSLHFLGPRTSPQEPYSTPKGTSSKAPAVLLLPGPCVLDAQAYTRSLSPPKLPTSHQPSQPEPYLSGIIHSLGSRRTASAKRTAEMSHQWSVSLTGGRETMVPAVPASWGWGWGGISGIQATFGSSAS